MAEDQNFTFDFTLRQVGNSVEDISLCLDPWDSYQEYVCP